MYSEFNLRKAIRDREFIPYYQPIISSCSGDIIGCEVLSRWAHPAHGVVEAWCFIREIERYDLAGLLTQIIMEDVLADVVMLNNNRFHDFMVTMNVTLSLIFDPVFRQYMVELNGRLTRAGVMPVFEITEREDIHLFPDAAQIFLQLSCEGIQFAVDDFGRGYAGESLLFVSMASFIKIDRQYIANPFCPVASAFIDNAIHLARVTGTRVVAEGVETQQQAENLRARGVEYLQGYYYGAPSPFGLFNYQLKGKPAAVLN
ncbi:hypothetical protein CJP72_10240 [Citrobacter sp. NCU1]|uniref:EAL domain-containing protein n=1 Tax=Citrobacter sp. NCU1 TaxID=2026683 RepID=UPI001391972D|nr:hypothetical protein [Citrobacter sp. NCU1]